MTTAVEAARAISERLELTSRMPTWRLVCRLKSIKADYGFFQTRHSIKRPALVIKELRAFIGFCCRLESRTAPDLSSRLCSRTKALNPQTVDLLISHLAQRELPTRRRHEITPSMRQDLILANAKDPVRWRRAAEEALAGMESRSSPSRGDSRRDGRWPLDQAFMLIGNLYQDLTGKRPTFTSEGPKGEPHGPFIDVALHCMAYLGHPNTTPDAIRSRFKRVKQEAGW